MNACMRVEVEVVLDPPVERWIHQLNNTVRCRQQSIATLRTTLKQESGMALYALTL